MALGTIEKNNMSTSIILCYWLLCFWFFLSLRAFMFGVCCWLFYYFWFLFLLLPLLILLSLMFHWSVIHVHFWYVTLFSFYNVILIFLRGVDKRLLKHYVVARLTISMCCFAASLTFCLQPASWLSNSCVNSCCLLNAKMLFDI